ncbi:methyltransferase domain-containing protein [Sphingomonas ginkgonis]|uniref:Methyltransferase domain-containing protein n=2 Tax=Sphingomonas ginkgonis TaxID=2315330 RepID=A0A429VDU4_9SPHN|nr:methyltransferase domain-containing protein [Sphingomonas ginkgonis]
MDNAAQGIAPADLPLALAIAGETLRRVPQLDALIDGATRLPLADDAKARMVLRLALAQKLALNVPDHAIVATALPLVEGGPRRLVHGVLGTLLRRGVGARDDTPLPPAVEERWGEAWGTGMVAAARRSILRRPPLDLSFKDEDAATSFAAASGGTSLAPRHVRLSSATPVTELPGFAAGDWWVQDLASSLPARLVPTGAQTVLDACAAPGGKTLQLAAAGHRVTALDRSGSRLARLRENFGRTGLAAEIVAADLLDWEAPEPFDAVLLDAPCSATGTFRRHPEVLHRVRPSYIEEAAALQRRLLDRSAGLVRPGGTLVYAVCSLEPQEGEAVIAAFLADRPDYRLTPSPVALPVPVDEGGRIRVLPGLLEDEGGIDGFFTARLVRAAA